jgi:hypothetical protein
LPAGYAECSGIDINSILYGKKGTPELTYSNSTVPPHQTVNLFRLFLSYSEPQLLAVYKATGFFGQSLSLSPEENGHNLYAHVTDPGFLFHICSSVTKK